MDDALKRVRERFQKIGGDLVLWLRTRTKITPRSLSQKVSTSSLATTGTTARTAGRLVQYRRSTSSVASRSGGGRSRMPSRSSLRPHQCLSGGRRG